MKSTTRKLVSICGLVYGVFAGPAQAQFNGACCFPNRSCTQTTQVNCQSQGGNFLGSGTSCTACEGACCAADGTCVVGPAADCERGDFAGQATDCTSDAGVCVGACCYTDSCRLGFRATCASGGEFLGLGSTCEGLCIGACCLTPGTCIEVDPGTCNASQGAYEGRDTTCAATQCGGACCAPDGSCNIRSPAGCGGSEFLGRGTTCGAVDCVGACCHPQTGCSDIGTVGCQQVSGEFRGHGTRCATTDCFGACCLTDKRCFETTSGACTQSSGDYQGDATTCEADCPSRLSAAFTYQGRLRHGGAPYSGRASMIFSLWDLPVNGQEVAEPVEIDSVEVVNGLFQTPLSFGLAAFAGNARWLQVEVCTAQCTVAGAFATLTPRQPITPAPYALKVPGIDGHSLDAMDGSPTDALLVDNEGNVGLGTDAPSAMLHFNRPFADTGMRFQTIRFMEGPPATVSRSPGAAVTNGPGQAWSNPSAARLSDDVRAVTSLSGAPGKPDPNQSQFLDLTNLGFALPPQAQIVGIAVQVEGSATCSCTDCDRCAVAVTGQLLGGAAPSRTHVFNLDATESTKTAGGTLDQWFIPWTVPQVNAGAFGVRLFAELRLLELLGCGWGCQYGVCDCTGAGSVQIDAVSVSVYYYDASATSTPVDFSIGVSQDDANLRIAPTADLTSPALAVTSSPGLPLEVYGQAAKPGGGLWADLSDRRLKRNAHPLTGALERMLSLRGFTFEFTEEGLRTGLALPGRHIGLIAQDVEAVFPDWVSETADGHKLLAERGTTALFVEALRELRAEKDREMGVKDAEIEVLNQRLSRLETALVQTERKGQ